MKIYILIFLIIIIIILSFQKRTDNFTSMESVQNVSRVYADTSGTMIVNNMNSLGNIYGNNIYSKNLYSNKITANYIDVSNNMNVSGNIKIKGNIDVSGTINGKRLNKDYFICTFAGISKLNETLGTELNLFKLSSWKKKVVRNDAPPPTSRHIMYKTRSSDSIDIDWENGKIVGLNPQKIYKVIAYIQFNLYDIDTDPTVFVARLKNGGEFLNESFVFTYQYKVNFTLTPVTIVKGSDATLLHLAMIRWGSYYSPVNDSTTNTEVLVTIDITEL